MNRKLLVTFFVTYLAFLGLTNLNAEASELSLTEEEKHYLHEVLELSEQEVSNIPIEEAKFLVENEAVVVNKFTETFDMTDAGPIENPREITPRGTISSNDLTFKGVILKLSTSAVSGYDAFHAYVDYDWINKPMWRLTDKISIGFPTSLGVYLQTSNGKIQGHYGSHWVYNTQTKGKTTYASTSTPSDSDPSAGVASSVNLHGTISVNDRLQGHVSQTYYVQTSKSGNANVKFEYGHKLISGSPSVSIIPSGLGISATGNIDTKAYYASFSY